MNQNNKWSPAKLEIEKQRAQREYLNEKWKFHDGIIDSVGADCAKSPKAAFDSSDDGAPSEKWRASFESMGEGSA